VVPAKQPFDDEVCFFAATEIRDVASFEYHIRLS
jgi:hypothetical protein